MSVPTVYINPDEEIALCCGLMFYQPTGYHSNPRSLWKDLAREGFRFRFEKVRDRLINQNKWQKYAPSPKDTRTPRVSYGKISCPHRFKYSIPLTSKNSSKVAKAFTKIYDVPNIPLQCPQRVVVSFYVSARENNNDGHSKIQASSTCIFRYSS
ncbi:7280_t:CDS:2 [Paraglomus brasilianum]|uniref:7280_t:CDS:1 n=1 Tax=Paraglomus brasilianum TaxID=144538 RepID=A0A9N9D1B9_9GLOM|nr:7280_t:CDS:2 [Paraglomus brasilianum]